MPKKPNDDQPDHADDDRPSQETDPVLAQLTPTELKVLKERLGYDPLKPPTLDEVERQFKITRERIRQLEEKFRKKRGENDGSKNES
jgi:DNA-directed RNA polymerase sigma subunit (sigma70/sigma32)